MASSWITTRKTGDGGKRYRVGGRESATRYGGSFKRKEDANARKRWIDDELAVRRTPDLRSLEVATQHAPTVSEAIERWRASRVDVAEGTRVLHRVALNRVVPIIGAMRVDEVAVDDVNRLVTELAGAGKKRETIRKSVKYLASVLEENGVNPNPARSKRLRLPHEEREEINRRQPRTSTLSTGFFPARTGSLCSGWTGRAPASAPLTCSQSAITTSESAASGCARQRRRPGRRSGWTSTLR
jgi:hypothetical protein